MHGDNILRKNVPKIIHKYKNGNNRSRSKWIQRIEDVGLQFQQQIAIKFCQKDYSISAHINT